MYGMRMMVAAEALYMIRICLSWRGNDSAVMWMETHMTLMLRIKQTVILTLRRICRFQTI